MSGQSAARVPMVVVDADAQLRQRRREIALLISAGVVASLHVGKVPIALPALKEALGLGLAGSGAIVSMFNVVGLVAALPLGALADRRGPRRFVVLGLLLMAGASGLGACATGPALLLVGRAVEGTGFILVVTSVPALLARLSSGDDRALTFGLWSGYMPAGAAIVMAAGPLLLPLGWRALWIAAGLAALLLAAGLRGSAQSAIAHAAGRAPFNIWSAFRATWAAEGPRLLAAIFATYTFQILAVLAFLPLMLTGGSERFAPSEAALLTSAAIALNVPGNLVGGWLLARGLSRHRLIIGGQLGMAVGAPLIYAEGLSFPLRYGACLLLTFCGGFVPAAVLSGTTVHAPRADLVASTNGLVFQGSNLGHTLGPPLVGAAVAAAGGWSVAPSVLVPAAALGCLLAWALGRIERRTAPV